MNRKSVSDERKEVRQLMPLIFVILILLADFAAVFFLSALSADFDLSVLKTSEFWANYVITLLLIFIAYFALIFYGNHKGNKSDEIISAQSDLYKAQKEVTINLLSGELEKHSNSKNVISKCYAIINRLDKKLRRIKKEEKRLKIVDEKKATVYTIHLEEEKIAERTLTDAERQERLDFIEKLNYNPNNYLFIKYRKIDKRIIFSSKRGSSNIIGKFGAGSIIFSESLIKISFSMICTLAFTLLLYGSFKWDSNAWFNLIWRFLLVCFNAYMGYELGYKMIVGDKRAALLERLDVFNEFKAFCRKAGYLKPKDQEQEKKQEEETKGA